MSGTMSEDRAGWREPRPAAETVQEPDRTPEQGTPAPREVLEQRLSRALALRDSLTVAIEQMRTARSLTFADDEHDPEGSTVSLDQARDVALLERTLRQLTELHAAHERMADGTYGTCQRCGSEIPAARLVARPEARTCVSCSRAGGVAVRR